MFFSIIPFSHSIGVQPLIYSGSAMTTDDLQIGQIVEIPYGKSTENGIVAAIHIDSPIDTSSESYARIKPIHRPAATRLPSKISRIRKTATTIKAPARTQPTPVEQSAPAATVTTAPRTHGLSQARFATEEPDCFRTVNLLGFMLPGVFETSSARLRSV